MRLEILTGSGCCCCCPCRLHRVFGYQCCECCCCAAPTAVGHGAHLEYLEAVKNQRYQTAALVWIAISLHPMMVRVFLGFIKQFEVENSISYMQLQKKLKCQVQKLRTTSFKISHHHRIAVGGRNFLKLSSLMSLLKQTQVEQCVQDSVQSSF